MRRIEIVSGGRVAAREPRFGGSLRPVVTGNGAISADAARTGPSRTSDRCVSAAGFSVVIEPAVVSLQQDGCASIATAACAQHGFIAQELRLAIAGKTPEIIRMAMAAKSVRITVANPCTRLAIPNRMVVIDIRTRRHTLSRAAYAWRLAGLILGAEERGNQLSDGLPPSGVNPARSW